MKIYSPKKVKSYPQRSSADSRLRQKYAIWDYYKKKNLKQSGIETIARKTKK